jgi:hypothetical protein
MGSGEKRCFASSGWSTSRLIVDNLKTEPEIDHAELMVIEDVG